MPEDNEQADRQTDWYEALGLSTKDLDLRDREVCFEVGGGGGGVLNVNV